MIVDYTRKLARALHVKGLINIQFIVHEGEVYVIEVNPRSSRTVPYISKVTGLPIVKLASEVITGQFHTGDRDTGPGSGRNRNMWRLRCRYSLLKNCGEPTSAWGRR